MRTTAKLLHLLLVITPFIAAACGDDDGSDETAEVGSAGPDRPNGSSSDNPEPFNTGRGSRNRNNNTPSPASLPAAQPIDDPNTTVCGAVTCRDVLVGDIVVEPCCPDEKNTCGLDLDRVSEFMSVTPACVALEQPGNDDSDCPDVYFDDAVDPRQLSGCCMESGKCGVAADFTTLLANFGCVDPRAFLTAGDVPQQLASCTPSEPSPEDAGTKPDRPQPRPDRTDAGSDGGPPRPSMDAASEGDTPPPVAEAGPTQPLDATTGAPRDGG